MQFRTRRWAALVPVCVLVVVMGPVTPPAVAGPAPAIAGPSPAVASGPAPAAALSASALALAAAQSTPTAAVQAAVAAAAHRGITQFVSVIDRSTGRALAQTANAGAQVGSESIMKLMLASYYIVVYGGYRSTPSSVLGRLSYMIRYSDDATANSLFTANAIPTIAARYGMNATTNSTDRIGHWGASRITARDMTTFVYRALRDPAVGPWLGPVMAQVAPAGSDGFNQHFGMNALTGTHGSKQGWGCDSYFTAEPCAIHSVGYTSRYAVAILQLSNSYPDPARSTSTATATAIAASSPTATATPAPPVPIRDGDFVRVALPGATQIYRVVGGAPVFVSSWSPFGGSQPVKNLTQAQFARLRSTPRDGTFVQAGQSVYRIAGGAPLIVTAWSTVGGSRPRIGIDPMAVRLAGRGGTAGAYNHLQHTPLDGTFLRDGTHIFRVAGGAPLLVTSWAIYGGSQPYTTIDPAVITHTSQLAPFDHLRTYPADNTYLHGLPGILVYRVLGGRPIHLLSWSQVGGVKPMVTISQATIDRAGSPAPFNHLRR